MALITLAVGFAAGYILRGTSPSQSATVTAAAAPEPASPHGAVGMDESQVTPEMLKRMADKQAEPLLAQLKKNAQDAPLLAKLGDIYFDTKNYQEAIDFYRKSLAGRNNATVRSDLGTSYWYAGNADAAIREFEGVLKVAPKNANAYFNLGMVKWQGKMDVKGAVAAWQKLLETNPNHRERQRVEALIARAQQHSNIKPGTQTNKPAM